MSPVHPDTLAALTSGIQSEVASYVFYTEAAKKSQAAEHQEVLRQLALEEKQHFQILERQYDSLVRSEKWISTADILKQDGLPQIDEKMSRQHQDLIDEVARATSLGEILKIAFRLEEEAHTLFSGAAAHAHSEEARKIFTQLSKFEEGHMRMVRQMQQEML
jgi:rubrerythrin